jgi:hypothetical protein
LCAGDFDIPALERAIVRASGRAINPVQEAFMNLPRQREDRATQKKVSEAIAMQRAFGGDTGKVFLRQNDLPPELLGQALVGQHDRRQDPDRRMSARPV